MQSLNSIRDKIDLIDKDILLLVNRRMEYVLDIARIKNQSLKPIFDFKREKEILYRLQKYNFGPMTSECVFLLFNSIMNISKKLMFNK